jgi:hypothetical protein
MSAGFTNEDHFRLAWEQLHSEPFDAAVDSVRNTIKAIAASKGASHKYHETITVAWMKLVATHRDATFDEFYSANAHRLNASTLHRFWSPELLGSPEAKAAWVAPDLAELPH